MLACYYAGFQDGELDAEVHHVAGQDTLEGGEEEPGELAGEEG